MPYMPNMPNMPKLCNITLATLNCRGLKKSNKPSTRQKFIRQLRSMNIDILFLQETHADSSDIENVFNMQFQTGSSFWSSHCGAVSLNEHYTLSLLNSDGPDSRYLFLSVHLDEQLIAYVLNVYAPASEPNSAILTIATLNVLRLAPYQEWHPPGYHF